jgi:tRNA nucleotidyltransferase/poly(A) polymerase
MGIKSKDLDYTTVLSGNEDGWRLTTDPFKVMVHELNQRGYKIFVENPEFLTARAQTPDRKETADFVLARSESDYTDGRRPDKVEIGNLYTDLARRDFTVNAIAKDQDGSLIDPFDGVQDIKDRIIRCVGDPYERFEEDALRILRAMRFAVTKGFKVDWDTALAMRDKSATIAGVSAERVREELTKMFNADPMKTIQVLREMDILPIIFGMGINFQPTMKQKVR